MENKATFSNKHIENFGTVNFQIFDTGFLDSFCPLITYINMPRIPKIVLFIYDVTNTQSFLKIDSEYKDIMKAWPETQFIIVGNKIDLDYREVSYERGHKYADSINAMFYEVSAKTSIGWDLLLQNIAFILKNTSVTQDKD